MTQQLSSNTGNGARASIVGQHVIVLGAGISGQAAALFAASLGAHVSISNDQELSDADRTLYAARNVKVVIGKQDAHTVAGADLLIVSPGIPESHPTIVAAHKNAISVMTEIDLALAHFSGRLIAITGTNGKSTTTAMAAHMLQKLGVAAVACGNIGLPPTRLLLENNPATVWVMELSSYQIVGSQPIQADVVIFTSFSQDHVARHGTVEQYFMAKWQLCTSRRSGALLIMSPSALAQAQQQQVESSHLLIRSGEGFDYHCTPLITKHDQLNAVFAATAVQHLVPHYTLQQLINTLNDFATLPYRYQFAGTIAAQPVINDSKSTNVESVLMALQNQTRPVLLMLGGQGKGESFAPIKASAPQVGEVWCFGAEGPKIYNELQQSFACKLFPTLKAALGELPASVQRLQMPVLFSPGCASFDEFKNFSERGHFFNEEVKKYDDNKSSN